MQQNEKTPKLDLKDKKILYELDINARRSNSEIGKAVRLNKNTVNYKIKRLEDEKVILNYYPVIDTSKLGYFSFRCYAKFFNTIPVKEKELLDWLVKDPRVGVVTKIETVFDFGFMIWVKDTYEFEKFWHEFKQNFREFFWSERIDIFTTAYNFPRKYLTESKEHTDYQFIGSNKTADHDELDLKILRILSKNARIPLIEIAEKLKTPERTIAFRIKRMEKNKIIQGYKINLSYEKLGLNISK